MQSATKHALNHLNQPGWHPVEPRNLAIENLQHTTSATPQIPRLLYFLMTAKFNFNRHLFLDTQLYRMVAVFIRHFYVKFSLM